ncbi:toll/interleukin-1 receptor domain-containing protein [Mesorhizobium sp. CA7]|uniref:toll/interleukin-1 receptor domain-containing protein n=1 Tax=Mesorhizobium sp. CA7 TaxID=588501 RepID=UPI001CC9EAAC|nr:toll/interleukin-1 receptor domain-containing protein [Mesorhizobium sp. CA7]MBZ9814745.1 toll/interleukin-1 receptor domain-containing protein [Mesorhizobium sp. CA7]
MDMDPALKWGEVSGQHKTRAQSDRTGIGMEPMTIFLSHSSVDKRFAVKLAQRLGRFRQLRIWIDQPEIKPGDSLTEIIGRALDSIDAICVIRSPDAAVSERVAKEVRQARRRYAKLRNIG